MNEAGYLEELASKLFKIKKQIPLPMFKDKRVYVFAADHGVVQNGVSAYPKNVTYQMVLNYFKGGAGINVFARHMGLKFFVVDSGVDYDFEDNPSLIKMKVGYGTKDFSKGPAMTREEAIRCIEYGMKVAKKAISQGADLLVIGDKGIGNTTTATAIFAAFGFDVDKITDIGTPIPPSSVIKKRNIVKKALKINRPNPNDPIDVLSKVGGYCIGQMAGFILEAFKNKVPVVVDGFPTTAGFYLAYKINEKVLDYAFFGHLSKVKGHKVILDSLGVRPILDLDMRLGEGTGAALSVYLIEAAIKYFNFKNEKVRS